MRRGPPHAAPESPCTEQGMYAPIPVCMWRSLRASQLSSGRVPSRASLRLRLVITWLCVLGGCSPETNIQLWVDVPIDSPLLDQASRLEVTAALADQPPIGETVLFEVPQAKFRSSGRFSFGLTVQAPTTLPEMGTAVPLAVWAGLRSVDRCLIGYGRTVVQIERSGLLAGCSSVDEAGDCSPQTIQLSAIRKTCDATALIAARPTMVDRAPTSDLRSGGDGRPLRLDGVGLRPGLEVCIAGVRQTATFAPPEDLLIPALSLPPSVPPGNIPIALWLDGRWTPAPMPILTMRLRAVRTQSTVLPWPTAGMPQIYDQATFAIDTQTQGLALLVAADTSLRLTVARVQLTGTVVTFDPHELADLEFPDKKPPAVGAPVRLLAAGIDDQGGSDLVVLSKQGTTLFLNPGSGAGYEAKSFPLLQGQDGLLTDLNGDGNADLLLMDTGVKLFRAKETPSGFGFEANGLPIGAFTQPCAAVAADFNQDGQPDLAVLTPARDGGLVMSIATLQLLPSFAVTVRQVQQVATVPQPSGLPLTGCPSSAQIAAADWDGDGRVDLAVLGAKHLYLNRHANAAEPIGPSSFRATPLHVDDRSQLLPGSILYAPDVNVDGLPDLLVSVGAENLQALLNQGSVDESVAPFSAQSIPVTNSSPPHQPLRYLLSDLNGDGFQDIIHGLAVVFPEPPPSAVPLPLCPTHAGTR